MKTIVLPAIKTGDYWPGIPLISYTRNSEPVDITNARIRMHLRKKHDSPGDPLLAWDTEDASIVMVDAALGKFKVEGRVLTVDPGEYVSDLEVSIDDKPDTILDFSWTISKSATRY